MSLQCEAQVEQQDENTVDKHKTKNMVQHRGAQLCPSVVELISGNITRSLNKYVLKVIGSEVRKGKSIHDDVFMEMYLPQNIM